MKVAMPLAVIVAALIAVSFAFTAEGVAAIVFGWFPFLRRVLPQMTFYWPSIAIAVVSLALFTCGIHWLACSIRSARESQNDVPPRRWKLRWTGAIVAMLLISFAAGTSVVGVVHQIGWLTTSERPFLGERLPGYEDSSEHNLKWISGGVSNYEDVKEAFPPAAVLSPDGQALHSWETQILHYMTYTTADIDQKQPWNSAANRRFFQCVLPEFINPGFRTPQLEDDEGYGLSHYAGNSRVMVDPPLKRSDVKDGESKTLLLGEVNADFSPWGRPFNVRDPSNGINCGKDCFSGPDARGGATFGMIDGSTRFISGDVDPSVLRALSTPADGDESAGVE